MIRRNLCTLACIIWSALAVHASEPLPSWSDSPSKRAILSFVASVTDKSGGSFVPSPQRIAVFDNDGTLWLEYTTIGNPLPSLGLLVHHTDAKREYAYDANPQSSGKLVSALAEAPRRGWVVNDMKKDWRSIF